MATETSGMFIRETQKSSRKRCRSTIWDKFTEEEDSQGNKFMKCKECAAKLSAYKNVLDRHWQTAHKDKTQTPKKILAAGDSKKKEPPTRYRRITSAFAEVLSAESIPNNLFRNPLMRNFIHELNPVVEIPSSFACLKKIPDSLHEQVKIKVKCLIAEMPQRGSITADIWTDKGMKHSYLGFTIHYCNSHGSLQRIFLGLSEIRGSHTRVSIRSDTELMLSEFGLEVENLFKVVTDGTSNISKAFNDIFPVDVNLQFLDADDDYGCHDGTEDDGTED